ncbi:MAG: cysteine dioxygenase family protein [Flavobacteriales bacterium]|nr:cysteine dioxygenase family protein [Flavobacteriales bacterium]
MVLRFELDQMASTIHSLEDLVRAIDNDPRPAGYTDALLRFSINPKALAPFCRWNTRHYTRQCIHRTKDHELLLICYEPGQRTSIHDYDSQMAWIKPLVGSVREERFKIGTNGSLKRHGERLLGPGKLAYMAAKNCIHRHSNPGSGRAITLNLYARPLRSWRMYDERTGRPSFTEAPESDPA